MMALGIELVVSEVHDGNYESALATMVAKRVEGIGIAESTFFVRDRFQIVELAAKHGLPATYELPEYARAGGLMAYGTSTWVLQRRRATCIDRIFNGAKPGELAIEQPTNFALAINLKAAKTLGIAIPQSVLLRADEVIQ